jgi:putative polyhydroxyalkanoate system protein
LVKISSSPISRPLIVLVPHRLGRQEARRRLDSGIDRLQRELHVLLSGLDYHWQGDTLNFSASAMWQRITGRIEVLDDAVRVEIELPWVMRLLRDTIAKRVRGRGVALLERPPGEA